MAALTGSAPWLAFTYLIALSYGWFHGPEHAAHFRALEYGALFGLLAWWRTRSRSNIVATP